MKVFLGGTCNGETWREEIIPTLEANEVSYFNPVCPPGVDWNEEWRKHEEEEKKTCNVELYVITSKMKGIFAIVEAVFAATTKYSTDVVLIIVKDGFDEAQLKSLEATLELLEDWALVALIEREQLVNSVEKAITILKTEEEAD